MSPEAPKGKEEEYFLQVQMQQLRDKAEALKKSQAESERKRLKELHWMRCPKCGMELKEITYRHISIDECFSCGGAFLDAGELQEIAAKEGGKSILAGFANIISRVK